VHVKCGDDEIFRLNSENRDFTQTVFKICVFNEYDCNVNRGYWRPVLHFGERET
jgi:hypothetical protein